MPTPYIEPGDVREAVAPDGNYSGTCAELNDEQLERHIARAQGRVDATTGFAYTAGNVPVLVQGVAIALASYYATLAYRKGKELGQYHPIVLQYQDAISTLTAIKQNLADTVPSADANQPVVSPGPSVFQPPGLQGGKLFTLEDVGLAVTQGGEQGVTVDPALDRPGVI